jgi:hypothetical protein
VLNLDQALAELPDTADGIAQMLIEADCQGAQRDGRCCPMANYLTRLGFVEPFVQPDYVQVNSAMPPTSWALREFVERFDDDEWPELVATHD